MTEDQDGWCGSEGTERTEQHLRNGQGKGNHSLGKRHGI